MRNAYENYFKIGVAVNTWQIEGQNEFAPAKDLIPKHFNSITMENEMKPEKLISKENVKKGDTGEVIVNIDRLDKVLGIVKNRVCY